MRHESAKKTLAGPTKPTKLTESAQIISSFCDAIVWKFPGNVPGLSREVSREVSRKSSEDYRNTSRDTFRETPGILPRNSRSMASQNDVIICADSVGFVGFVGPANVLAF